MTIMAFYRVCIFWLIIAAVSVLFSAFKLHLLATLRPGKTRRAMGTLVAFRDYDMDDQLGSGYEDYTENRKKRRPVFIIDENGKELEIASSLPYPCLTGEDIGKRYSVVYKSGFASAFVIDSDSVVQAFNYKQRRRFGVLLAVGLILSAMVPVAVQMYARLPI